MSRFWPVCEPGQAAYERLRTAVLAGTPLVGRDATRFARGGLRALIVAPVAEPLFVAHLVEVPRPAWTPYTDPRLDTLAEVYQLLTIVASTRVTLEVAAE
jgi:hypothetical protein